MTGCPVNIVDTQSRTYGAVSVLSLKDKDCVAPSTKEQSCINVAATVANPTFSRDPHVPATLPRPLSDLNARPSRTHSVRERLRTKSGKLKTRQERDHQLKLQGQTHEPSRFADMDNSSSGTMHAPFNQEPSRDDNGAVCLLTSSHYIVPGSIGLGPRRMRSHHIAMDTGCGPNVTRRRDLSLDWERHLIDDDDIPALGDAKGNPLTLLGKIVLRVRLDSVVYHVAFVIAEQLAVGVIIGTSVMNKNGKRYPVYRPNDSLDAVSSTYLGSVTT